MLCRLNKVVAAVMRAVYRIKYRNHLVSSHNIAPRNQSVWAIDENAIIFRSEV